MFRLVSLFALLLLAGCFNSGQWETLEWHEGPETYARFPAPGLHGEYNVTHWPDTHPASKVASRFRDRVDTTLYAYEDGQARLSRRAYNGGLLGEDGLEKKLAEVFEDLRLADPTDSERRYRHGTIPD